MAKQRPIYEITADIVEDMKREYLEDLQKYTTGKRKSAPKHWKDKYCYFTARGSQMEAMLTLSSINDTYIMESAGYIVACALGNLSTWKGDKAREIKKELKAML